MNNNINPTFEDAIRHSERIYKLRIILPSVAVAIAMFFIVRLILSLAFPIDVGLGEFALYDGKLVMEKPRLTGVSKSNEPYEIKAERAIQDSKDDSEIILENINATFAIQNNNIMRMKTKNGTYKRNQEILIFNNHVDVRIHAKPTSETQTGFKSGTMNLQNARIDIANGSLNSRAPVEMQWEGGKLNADTFQILEHGKIMVFESSVKTILQPDAYGENK